MNKILQYSTAALFIFLTSSTQALIIDFDGGVAHLSTGVNVSTSDTMTPFYYGNVDYYIEDGVRFDFLGGYGTVGRYYDSFGHPELQNSVVHAHWASLASMRISMVDGSLFDFNYVDLSSNTTSGGGAASGTELSYISNNSGFSQLLPSSDWGLDYLFTGAAGDGIERLWLPTQFDNVEFVDITSDNAYCFGLDNFYINEPPPDPIPAPAPMTLISAGIFGLLITRKALKH